MARRLPRDVWVRAAAALWIAAMVTTLLVGTFGSAALRERFAEDGLGCPFRRATSIECAFCGMTHATIALGHGDLRAAFAYHPLAPLILLGMFAACGAIVVGRSEALMVGRRPFWILGAIAAIWIVNLLA